MAVVIALDLDNFTQVTTERGWSPYSPNPVTRYLTHAVSDFAQDHHATILSGVDSQRGTEEAQMYCSHPDMDTIIHDLNNICKKIQKMGVTLSVGIAQIPFDIPAKSLQDYPLAKKALRKSKRKGKIIVL
jgi:GGDEF domain-containing protein